jgi:hypothetical protein
MRLGKLARTAGVVVLALVLIDLVAAAATVAVGAVLLKR